MARSQSAAVGGPYDITIVGAGMAGLYSAWRLLSPAALQSPVIQQLIDDNGTGTLRLCFIEGGTQVGGRLDSYTFKEPGGVDVTVDMGGMRFQESHKLVWQVVQELKLQTIGFPISKNRLFYLRGTQIWESEITSGPGPGLPYQFANPAWLRQTPDQLFNTAVSNAVGDPDAPNWSADRWKAFIGRNTYTSPAGNPVLVYNNISYEDIGFWNLLFDQIGDEAYRYLTDAGGYDSNTINWNAALAMPYVASGDYGTAANYLTLVGGYQTLPLTLASAISGQLPIQFGAWLQGITKNADGSLGLTVFRGFDTSVIRTKNLMLCMPRRSLELLDPDTEFSNTLRNGKLNSVISQPALKLVLLFEQEWWRNVNIRGKQLQPYGPSITDLPLRMVWYFDEPIIVRSDGAPNQTKYWALLASYSDMVTEQFWRAFADPLLPGGGLNGPAIPAPPPMVNMALAQLALVHGFPIPQPVAAMFKDWGADPYGGGYHAWAVHENPWLTGDLMLNPLGLQGYNVYVCGEAYSLDQGWVEGALRTAETVLTQYFQLPVLDGVSADYVRKAQDRHGQ
jgi:hypothetical protein